VNDMRQWMRKGVAAIAAPIATSVLFFACGKSESNPARPPKAAAKGDVDVASRQSRGADGSEKTASPYADLTANLVEKTGLLPIGYIETQVDGTLRQCMGAYVGSGKMLTAAHCLAGVSLAGKCPPTLRIRWLRQEAGNYSVQEDAAACTDVVTTAKDVPAGSDLALVTLASVGTWPGEALQLETSSGVLAHRVKMVGPQGHNQSLLLRARLGTAYQDLGDFILTNAQHAPGFSGAPVYAGGDSTSTTVDPSSRAVGLHLGSLSGGSRMLKGEILKKFLEGAGK